MSKKVKNKVKTPPKKKLEKLEVKEKKPAEPSEVKGILALACSVVMFLSLLSFTDGDATTNWLGLLGYSFAYTSQYLFGLGSYAIVVHMLWLSWQHLKGHLILQPLQRTLYFSLLLSSLCILLNVAAEVKPSLADELSPYVYSEMVSYKAPYHYRELRHNLGGVPFYYIYRDLPHANLQLLLSNVGTSLVCVTTIISSTMLLTPFRISSLKLLTRPFQAIFRRKEEEGEESEGEGLLRFIKLRLPQWKANSEEENREEVFERRSDTVIEPKRVLKERPPLTSKFSPEPLAPQKRVIMPEANFPPPPTAAAAIVPNTELSPSLSKKEANSLSPKLDLSGRYILPPVQLLSDAPTIDQSSLKESLRRQAEVLEETLSSFGIEARVGEIHCGPTITSFEVHPAIGVKVQKIKSLSNDIALNLEAQSIRIIAPIPGKAAVGIEVPNPSPQEVGFKKMMINYLKSSKKAHIPVLLGETVHGNDVSADLTKMPHCIIAGATGSGKSVCINTIIMSILMNASPDEIKLLMIDPKKVELTPYSKLPHMIAPVITEPHGASAALNWLVKEMQFRYEILKQLGLRNIASFNSRKANREAEEALEIQVPEKMPYIVGIIDELADLMMVASSDIETPIARIAQMARAVGIHLILATQRPSREVITGIIKANFPTRIAFKVASRINSQIILDETGAESLLGNGDMLFLPPGTSNLMRAQGAYIRDSDINKVIQHCTQQAPTNYLIPSFDNMTGDDDFALDSLEDSNLDSLYKQALELVKNTGNASTTFLQRKLKIGYARAASIMDQLEDTGVVGPQEGSKAREVLIGRTKPAEEA